MNLSDAEKHTGDRVTVVNQGEILPALIVGVPFGTGHVRVQTLVPDAEGHEVVGQVLDLPPGSVTLDQPKADKPAAKKTAK